MRTLVERLREASEPGTGRGEADLCESHRQLMRDASAELELLTVKLDHCRVLAEVAVKAIELAQRPPRGRR